MRSAWPLRIIQVLWLAALVSSGSAVAQAPQKCDCRIVVELLSGFSGNDGNTFAKSVLPGIMAEAKKGWYPLIPSSAQPPRSEQRKVGIRFDLDSDGKVRHMVLESPSGDLAFDRAAWGALCRTFGAFPPEMKTESIKLRFFFLYNTNMNLPPISGKQGSSTPNPVN